MKNRERITAADFEQIAVLPENADKRLEFVAGQVIEAQSNNYASSLAAIINGLLFIYLREHPIGWLTGAQGGYAFGDERYLPNLALVLHEIQSTPTGEIWPDHVPALVVETVTTETAVEKRVLQRQITAYLAAGTVVWVVRPEFQQVEVHAPGQPVTVYGTDDALPGGTLLPGFTLPVRELFK